MNLEDLQLELASRLSAPKRGSAIYAVVDTTFAVARQGARAVDQLMQEGVPMERIRYACVPGFKDLGPMARQMLDAGADIAICCGMAGPEEIDKQCAQDASFGIQLAQHATGKLALEVIIHMDETETEAELVEVVDNRVREHATNAFWMMEQPQSLAKLAGTGQRQGFEDHGSIEP